jgi:outer membrane receptor protein involved in Fe transport
MNLYSPFSAADNNHPAATTESTEASREVLGQLTQVLGTRAVNVVKAGVSSYEIFNGNLTTWNHHWQAPDVTVGSPRITFRGFSIAGNTNYPRNRIQRVWSARDDFSLTYEAAGMHALKLGGEALNHRETTDKCDRCMGIITANGGPIPDPAALQAMFPDPFKVDTWNLAALSPITTRYQVGVSGNHFVEPYTIPKYAGWAQDDWKMSQRLTLNLGVRYDFVWNAFAQSEVLLPWLTPGRPQDTNNLQPRLGFAYSLNDRTVIRGGAGRYYADVTSPNVEWSKSPSIIAILSVANDGRPDFAARVLRNASSKCCRRTSSKNGWPTKLALQPCCRNHVSSNGNAHST